MERSPHSVLVGQGASTFAREQVGVACGLCRFYDNHYPI